MLLNGSMLIGQSEVQGSEDKIQAIDPSNGNILEPTYFGGNINDVNKACELANKAFDTFRKTSLESRANFLDKIAQNIMDLGDELVERVTKETGLATARIEGERGRTCNQLKLFASVVRDGNFLDIRIDPALKDRTPPRPDLRMKRIAIGPVAVFGASNFPLAFSVAGGDTASAFAAGCPVVVKAHSAHPGTSELVGRAIQKAVKELNLPEGVFSLIFGSGKTVGSSLVQNSNIKAVGFTGSRSGGTALMQLAFNRKEPIPVYAEMSSINPVFIFNEALKNRPQKIAEGLIASLTMGAGQFCTNPGLVFAQKSEGLDKFIGMAKNIIESNEPQTMLTPHIHKSYNEGLEKVSSQKEVTLEAKGKTPQGPYQCQPTILKTSAKNFLSNEVLSSEVFGSTTLFVECENQDEFDAIAESLEGQLTATLHIDDKDFSASQALVETLERKVGRILCNGYPTGVDVSHTMVHGGPFPATSDSRTTSVGSAAIERFLRPVCYQDFPTELLDESLKDDSTVKLKRMVDGEFVS